MSDNNKVQNVTCQIVGDTWETIPCTQDEIEGYIFAGIKAVNALEKWRNEDAARQVARAFAAALMPIDLLRKYSCPQCSRTFLPAKPE